MFAKGERVLDKLHIILKLLLYARVKLKTLYILYTSAHRQLIASMALKLSTGFNEFSVCDVRVCIKGEIVTFKRRCRGM